MKITKAEFVRAICQSPKHWFTAVFSKDLILEDEKISKLVETAKTSAARDCGEKHATYIKFGDSRLYIASIKSVSVHTTGQNKVYIVDIDGMHTYSLVYII